MTYLLDTNGFIALLVPQHVDHHRVHHFFKKRTFATSPQIQLGALRFLTRPRTISGSSKPLPALHKADEALRLVRWLTHAKAKTFVAENLNCAGKMPFDRVTGHRQWNDFYLVALAQHHSLMLGTCDQALHRHFPEVVKFIP
jgi:predicted nucleic acid-binding protein